MPKVSIVMPCYNGLPYLKEAVESILHQTLTDFELIIVDGASTDDSVAYIRSLQDPRLRLLVHDKKEGIGPACNAAIDVAQGEYIARHDVDDISHPERLEKQVRFMDTHPDVVLSSCAVQTFGQSKRRIRHFGIYIIIRALIPFRYMFCNTCIIYRRNIMAERRYPALTCAEDQLFIAGAALKYKASNISQVLYYYREHSDSASFAMPKEKLDQRNFIFKELITQRLCFEPTTSEVECHINFLLNRRAVLYDFSIMRYLAKALIKGRHTFPQRCILGVYFIATLSGSAIRMLMRSSGIRRKA